MGKSMGQWEIYREINGKKMGKLWEIYGEIHGKMGKLWEIYGEIHGKNGKAMGNLWGNPWEKWGSYGKSMGKSMISMKSLQDWKIPPAMASSIRIPIMDCQNPQPPIILNGH